MPLHVNMTEDDKLARARRLFREAESFAVKSYEEKSRNADFFHGRQWTDEESKYLEDRGRPALTFNVIAPRVRSIVGMNIDNRMDVSVAPIGKEDQFKATVIGALYECIARKTKLQDKDDDIFERGVVEGDHALNISVSRDPKRPQWSMIDLSVVSCREVTWDPSSRERDRSDAKYFFWHKWISREDFEVEYPDHKEQLDALFGEADHQGADMESLAGPSTIDDGNDYEAPIGDRFRWLNKRKRMVRVIHMEYVLPKKVHYLVDDASGQQREISSTAAKTMRERLPDAHIVEVWQEETRWFEFFRNGTLFDDVSPEPFEGYSLIPFSCFIDTETGFAYGPVRAMIDPQQDVNKGHSLSLEHLMNQPRPGYNAEQGSLSDVVEFDRAIAEGRTAITKPGALSGGTIQPRTIAVPSPAALERVQRGLMMVGEVSGIVETAESPNRAQEQPVTFMLREKKSLRAHRGLMGSFQQYQEQVAAKIIESMMHAFPDQQLIAMLGNSERYAIENGVIIDREGDEEDRASIRDLRANQYDIELQPSSVSDTNRLNQLQLFTSLSADPQVFVEPEFKLELAAETRGARDRLIKHQRQASAQAQEQAQLQSQELTAKIGQIEADTRTLIQTGGAKVENDALKIAADAENDRMKLVQADKKSQTEAMLKLLEIIQQGDVQAMDAVFRTFDMLQQKTESSDETTTLQ